MFRVDMFKPIFGDKTGGWMVNEIEVFPLADCLAENGLMHAKVLTTLMEQILVFFLQRELASRCV